MVCTPLAATSERRERNLGEGVGRGDRALVELLDDREHEGLLLRVALKLVEHLLRAEGDLADLAAAVRREAQQQREQPREEVDLLAVLAHQRRGVQLFVVLRDARLHAQRHRAVRRPEERRLDKVIRVGE